MTAAKTNPMVQPYLFFDGRCDEALEFYGKTLGAKLDFLMRFKDNPEPPKPEDWNGPNEGQGN